MAEADNPYRAWVRGVAAAVADGAGLAPVPRHGPVEGGPLALLFAPHPDDEAIVGGLPLRLRREAGWAIRVVAVTLGADRGRRAARWREQQAACAALGFDLVTPDADGLDAITPAGRAADAARWAAAAGRVAALIEAARPRVLFLPHAGDWHQTHIGTHHLVADALALLPSLDVLVFETEFWGANPAPNLMVESSADDVAELVAALALHAGEVSRNPYHLRLPAWMMDNVRRGAELVGGQGAGSPGFPFATLYRRRRWHGGWQESGARLVVGAADPVALLVAAWK